MHKSIKIIALDRIMGAGKAPKGKDSKDMPDKDMSDDEDMTEEDESDEYTLEELNEKISALTVRVKALESEHKTIVGKDTEEYNEDSKI